MTKRLVVKTIALATVGMFLMVGTARADEWTAETHLHLHVKPHATIDPNQKITFWGFLKSDRKACYAHQKVKLIRRVGPAGVEGKVVDTTETDGKGRYEFPRQGLLIRTSDWRVRFKGFIEGEHPNIHTCLASSSGWITVTVVGGPPQ